MKPVSLRLLLVIPFVLQISAAVGLTGYLSWRNSQSAVQDLAGQLRNKASNRVSQHLDNYLDVPSSLVNSHKIALDIGLLDLQNREQLQLSFWHKVKTHQIDALLLGFETSEFVSVGHLHGDERITVDEVTQATPSEGGLLLSREIDELGQPAATTEALGPFRAQDESWYKAAITAGQRTWSPVYNSLVEPYNLSIALSQPLYGSPDGQGQEGPLIGVLAAEQQLANLSRFLQSLHVSAASRAFIIERDGSLIGSSAAERPFVVTADGMPQRLLALESRDPLIQATAQFLEQSFPSLEAIGTAQQLDFFQQGERQYLQVTPWRGELGLDWLVVVVMPEADFMGQIQANARRTWLLCSVALLVATGSGVYTAYWIAKPIRHLSEAAGRMTAQIAQQRSPELAAPLFNLTQLIGQPRPLFHELGLLSAAFQRMAEQLANSFEQLTHVANHDALTGLPNRFALERQLTARLAEQSAFAVLFLDLDYFKIVNDSLGHEAGDRLLQAVAQRLGQILNEEDVVARFGGDEFVVLLASEPNQPMSTRGVVVANCIIQQLQQPFVIDQREVFIGTSVGIVTQQQFSQEAQTASDLLRSADTALYRAKAKGKGKYAVFNSRMHCEILQQIQLETDLRRAIEQKQLELYYQPIVDNWSGQVVGFEALLRWWNPKIQAFVPPGEFIPIAEETGLILPLTDWVLKEACRQMQAWQISFGWDEGRVMHVNVASQQLLQPNWVASLQQVLAETALSPHCLGLELTERTLVSRQGRVQRALSQLAELGVQVSIDDFGTGYSSLAYLQEFSIHTLKIDRSFIQPLSCGTLESSGIVRAIVGMAHTLGLDLIAEGVETEEQRQILMRMGCRKMQGYYCAKPAAAQAIEQWLLQRRSPSQDVRRAA